jgi:hypothetical protein
MQLDKVQGAVVDVMLLEADTVTAELAEHLFHETGMQAAYHRFPGRWFFCVGSRTMC